MGRRARKPAPLALLLLLLATAVVPSPGLAQSRGQASLRLVGPSGGEATLPVLRQRGYAAVSILSLEEVGWRVQATDSMVTARLGDRVRLILHPGNPFFTWNDSTVQLSAAPYFFGRSLYVPLQLVTEILPLRLGDEYAAGPGARTLTVRRPEVWTPSVDGAADERSRSREDGPDPSGASTVVVVIDPGHGGKDTGALGPRGILEKDVALGVGKELARDLQEVPGIEVHMTRDDDSFVPLWKRGEMATRWKGDRPGLFLSIHVNAITSDPSIRGFETYFLSEARTDHERRVAALENAPLEEDGPDSPDVSNPNADLSFILNDLRNRDYVHWSALLAQMVQDHLDGVHPGPDRGVKQGPFAVITNALMPGVLVELGFITNDAEARLLARKSFEEKAAGALTGAVRDFFRRYPPGGDVQVGASR